LTDEGALETKEHRKADAFSVRRLALTLLVNEVLRARFIGLPRRVFRPVLLGLDAGRTPLTSALKRAYPFLALVAKPADEGRSSGLAQTGAVFPGVKRLG
jgi:hypothetical protein